MVYVFFDSCTIHLQGIWIWEQFHLRSRMSIVDRCRSVGFRNWILETIPVWLQTLLGLPLLWSYYRWEVRTRPQLHYISCHNINITVHFIRNSFILCGLLFIELTVALFLLLFQNFEEYVVHSMNLKLWTELSDFKQNTPISPWASKRKWKCSPRFVAECEIWRAKFVFWNVSLTGLLTAPDRILRLPVAHGQFTSMLEWFRNGS